jgi:hypothetical protein
MSGHKKWESIRRDGIPKDTSPEMLSYVQGYILALEDVLSDLKDSTNCCQTYDNLLFRVTDSLENAKRTLESLK